MADNAGFVDGPEDAVEQPVHGSYRPLSDKAVVLRPGELAHDPTYAQVHQPHHQASHNPVSTSSYQGYVPTITAPLENPPIPEKQPISEKQPIQEKQPIPDLNHATPQAFKYDGEKKILEAVEVDLAESIRPDKPYAGMGKEDLLRFSQTPFWNRFRMFCNIVFWLCWLGLLGAVVALTITYPKCVPPPEKSWHEVGVFYQIYVKSFYDTDGDGIGDINGIRQKLDYLKEMKVDALMLSSIYLSNNDTMSDHGYEVINHTQIDSVYGTMNEFEHLLEEAHNMDIRIIMDFIPNYTGTQHPWFQMSSSSSDSATNPYWNYYVWADCDGIDPVNNWRTMYGETMWTYNDTRSQCYLHQFLNTQPELNLRSGAVQAELEDIMRFWLYKGVDGFKTDKVMHLFEDVDLRDEPVKPVCTDPEPTDYNCYEHIYTTSQDEIFPVVGKWRDIIDEVSQDTGIDRILITDARDDVNGSLLYYGRYGPDGAHFPINFQLTSINTTCGGKCVQRLADDFLYGVPTYAVADWLTGTQDLSRHASILHEKDWGWQNAYTMLKMTMPGVAIMYYGEEIGMENVNTTLAGPVDPVDPMYSRDPYRSPMQWTMDPNDAGFISDNATKNEDPWLPVGDNLHNISIEAQNGTDFSPLEFYRAMVELRNSSETFAVGTMQYTLLTDNVISYYRAYDGLNRYLVAINFGPADETVDIAGSHYDIPGSADVALTTRADQTDLAGGSANLGALFLRAGDGTVLTWAYVRPDGK